MAKKLPLIRRLELALQECDSESSRKEVYGKLYKTAQEASTLKNSDLFYGRINQNSLSPSYNRKPISPEEIEYGRDLAHFLENSINLPERGKGYREKMVRAMNVEFEKLVEYFSENES